MTSPDELDELLELFELELLELEEVLEELDELELLDDELLALLVVLELLAGEEPEFESMLVLSPLQAHKNIIKETAAGVLKLFVLNIGLF